MLNASLILTVHTIDTSTGELLVPEGILRPVVSASKHWHDLPVLCI